MRICGPGRVRIASGEDNNHFAGCASLTDLSKRGGNLVEREGAVDVDPDVSGNAEGGKRLKMGRPLVDSKDPYCTSRYVPPGASARR